MKEEFTFSRVWFITGTSTGFGCLLAGDALKGGERVIATARDGSKLSRLARRYPDRIRALTLDVTNPTEITSIAQQGIAAFGHVDILVNNAGYGVNGAIVEVSEDEFEPMFQTNIYGLIPVTRAIFGSVQVKVTRNNQRRLGVLAYRIRQDFHPKTVPLNLTSAQRL